MSAAVPTLSVAAYMASLPNRCAKGFHLTTQHPQLCDCIDAVPVAPPAALRDAALSAVNSSASPDDRARIDAAIRRLASAGGEFSANSVRDLVPDVPGPLMGARFQAAAKAGVIVRTGYVPSTKGSTHAHPIATWKAAA